MLTQSIRIANAVLKVPLCVAYRSMSVSVGDKVPVSFMGSTEDPVIKEDSEYPDWVHSLADPLPTKAQLLAKYQDPAFDNKDLTPFEIMRLKRLVTLNQIKEANALSSA